MRFIIKLNSFDNDESWQAEVYSNANANESLDITLCVTGVDKLTATPLNVDKSYKIIFESDEKIASTEQLRGYVEIDKGLRDKAFIHILYNNEGSSQFQVLTYLYFDAELKPFVSEVAEIGQFFFKIKEITPA